MKTAISMPDPVFKAADRLARRLRVSRSRLCTDAVDEYVHRHASGSVTEQLNAVYHQEDSRLDPLFQTLQGQAISRETW